MDSFVIYSEDNPKPEIPAVSYTAFDEGNYTALQTGIGRLWAFQDAGEPITVHVAVPRRTAVLEAREEITYANLHLMPA